MKIKTKELSYDQVMALPRAVHRPPRRPGILFRTLMRTLAAKDLRETGFTYTEIRMEEVGDQPCLILMNHSSFIDLEIAAHIFARRPFCIVCTSDGFVGKEWLMRRLGCIPTQKFVNDVTLLSDIQYALHEIKTSVLMYPEASYTFDGCTTPLPRKLGILLKRLDVPVVMVTAHGAFARDPLYNCLQKRSVTVSAEVRCLLTREEIKEKRVAELDDILDRAFAYDHFAWQYENGIEIREPFRADGLNRILYRCAHCGTEGEMEGSGMSLTCHRCGKRWQIDPLGRLCAEEGETEFPHIPDWYRWEREALRGEIRQGEYRLDIPVKIGMMVDYRAIYMVGEGRLQHSTDGFLLTGCDGKLEYRQSPLASYSLYSDYFWYEIGDVICIGDRDRLFYCFPQCGDVVAKTRMAAEEIFRARRFGKNAGSDT